MVNPRCISRWFRLRLLIAGLTVPALLWAGASSAVAQKKAPARKAKAKAKKARVDTSRPIAVINAASVNRLLQDVEATFKSAEKPQMFDVVKSFLGNFDDLKGMDRDKPFGVMLFLSPGVPPSVTPVGYFPVTNMADLMKSLANGPFTTKKIPGKKDRYEIQGPNGSPLYLAVKGNYVYASNAEASLDETYPDPTKAAEGLSKRYDFSLSVNMNAVAQESRELFATLLRTAAEGELQQRDKEPKAAYETRRAIGMRDIEWLEAALLGCERLVVGLDASSEKKQIVIEAALDVRKKTKMAKMLKAIGGKRSYFDTLLNDKAPLSMSVSWGLNKFDQQAMAESFRFLGGRIAYALDPERAAQAKKENEKKAAEEKKKESTENKKKAVEKQKAEAKKRARRFRRRGRNAWLKLPIREYDKNGPVGKIIEPLIATAQKGHADFFLQFNGEPPEKFTVILAARVENARQLSAGLKDVLTELQKQENAPKITFNAETYKTVTFHKVEFPNIPRNMKRFFGDSPAMYVGASSKAVWVVFGGKQALPLLQTSIDKVIENKTLGQKKGPNAPFKIAVNVASWLAMGDGGEGRPRPGRDLARKAFAKGGDAIRLEIRTTDQGVRFRATLDEGFLKFIGMAVARQYERRQGI